MNSYTFMGLDDVEEGEEISSHKKSFIKRAIAYIKMRRQATRVTRNNITRDHAGAHTRLVATFFLRPRCTMKLDFERRISPLIKCTSAIHQLAYDVNTSFLDEYMQISERSSRKALDHFCQAVMEIYGPEYLRNHTVTDVEKLYRHYEEKHGFMGMLRSHDCTDWEWFGCLYALKAQYVRHDHGSNPFILMEAVASQDDMACFLCRAPEIPFVVNSVTYRSGYYLVDGIYPKLATLVKTIPKPADDDHKQILYKKKQESTRKDVERAFGVLKKKWAILTNPTRTLRKDRIVNMIFIGESMFVLCCRLEEGTLLQQSMSEKSTQDQHEEEMPMKLKGQL
uniref:Protein ALP1-like n=1 Tax=Tanacetum cinerariifolium TaxID=118510 RepID=A0A699GZ20_TANCI|nr:hypothetical protein [Tanacetum cinerariifolium]